MNSVWEFVDVLENQLVIYINSSGAEWKSIKLQYDWKYPFYQELSGSIFNWYEAVCDWCQSFILFIVRILHQPAFVFGFTERNLRKWIKNERRKKRQPSRHPKEKFSIPSQLLFSSSHLSLVVLWPLQVNAYIVTFSSPKTRISIRYPQWNVKTVIEIHIMQPLCKK